MHHNLQVLIRLAAASLFGSISFVILAFSRVEIAHKKCHNVLYSQQLSSVTRSRSFRMKVLMALDCAAQPTSFTLLDIAVVSYNTYQIVSHAFSCENILTYH